jgi:HD-GYP domain-containing protein (c-di-GMP phosphodiesterase class II)
MTPDEAVAILKANAGTQFDPDVVAAFVRLHHRVSQDEIRRADSPYHPDLDRLSAALSKAAGEESASAVKEVLS